MRRHGFFLPIFIASLSASGRISAQIRSAPAKFTTLMIGGTGAPPQIGPGAGDEMETISRQQGGDGTFGRGKGSAEKPAVKKRATPGALPVVDNGRPAQAPAPSRNDAPASPAIELPRPVILQNETKAVAARRPQTDRRRYSLWEGLASPLELPGAKIKDASPDSALALGRKDYESHILQNLGLPGQAEANPRELSGPALKAQARPHEVFVAVDLDLKSNPGQLKDAVANLVKAADFRPDSRFEARLEGAAGDKASVWGWLPADSVAAVMKAPAVARLEIETGPARQAPSARAGSVSEMLLGIRLPPEASGNEARAVLARVLPQLAADAGFLWKRTVGTQQAPGSKEMVVIVAGEVPIKNLSRVMSHPDVVKMLPSPDVGRAEVEVPPNAAADRGFLAFVLSRYPALILLTATMLLALFRPSFSRLVEIFIPYNR